MNCCRRSASSWSNIVSQSLTGACKTSAFFANEVRKYFSQVTENKLQLIHFVRETVHLFLSFKERFNPGDEACEAIPSLENCDNASGD